MRELWRKAVELFWEHPILWMPYVVAELCSVIIAWAGTSIRHHIVNSFLVKRSVLGGEYRSFDPDRIHNALGASAPVEVTQHLFEIIVTAVALVWTARVLEAIMAGQLVSLTSAFHRLKADRARILWFSLKFAACVAAGLLLLFSVATPITIALHKNLGLNIGIGSWVFACAVFATIAWVMTPAAIRLLRDSEAAPIEQHDIRLARKFTVLMTLASFVLSFAYDSIRHRIQTGSAVEGQVVGAIATLVASSPLLLLFIALALLSLRPTSTVEMTAAIDPEPPAELI